MKRIYKLENLDCANCARKLEKKINKLDLVSVVINFMTLKMTVEFNNDVEDKIFEIVRKFDSNINIKRCG